MDETLVLAVWRDNEPINEFTEEFGAMGTLIVQEVGTRNERHRERIALSRQAILGGEPTDDELERWGNIFLMFEDR